MKIYFYIYLYINGDWGLGIGDWGMGNEQNNQSTIPNPQSPKIKKIKQNFKFFQLVFIY